MKSTEPILEFHQKCREEAAQAYLKNLDPVLEGELWRETVACAEAEVLATLAATKGLTDVEGSLRDSGSHARVLRFLMAPPLSQDQFKLACSKWQKCTEKSGRPLSAKAARAAAETFLVWADPKRLEALEEPHGWQKSTAVASTAHMIAIDSFRTERRMRLAQKQEQEVIELLRELGYRERKTEIVDRPDALARDEFVHATKFATGDGSTHEVDIAVGLPKRTMLAIECKVSNDKTNSVKRVNDVLKKAKAWKDQWGNYVLTGAVLQGVFGVNEPRRLLEDNVVIFWSHRLDELADWLTKRRSPSEA